MRIPPPYIPRIPHAADPAISPEALRVVAVMRDANGCRVLLGHNAPAGMDLEGEHIMEVLPLFWLTVEPEQFGELLEAIAEQRGVTVSFVFNAAPKLAITR